MQIFNTMTRQKEEFVPQKEGEYRIYVCGPTVYNYIHIGNARPMIVFDTLRRYLEYCGNKVYYVSNITDIDDKLIKKGQEEGTSMQEVARKFEAEYIRDSDGLNVKAPTVRPRATEHIGEIIHIVKDLVDSGHAYVARCTHNSVITEIMPVITYSIEMFTKFKAPRLLEDTIRTHWQIAEAICANDPQKAYDSMYEHVSENSESIEIVRRMSMEQNQNRDN